MTLQSPLVKPLGKPNLSISNTKTYNKIYCRKCGNQIVFDKDHIAPSGKKVPLDPYFNREPHQQYCMYGISTSGASPDLEPLLFEFLRIMDMPKHTRTRSGKAVIGAVGMAEK